MKIEFYYELEGMNRNHWIVTVTDEVNGKSISATDVFKDEVSLNDVYSRMLDLLSDEAFDLMSPYM